MKAGAFINKYMKQLLKRERIQADLAKRTDRKRGLADLAELLQFSYHRYLEDYYARRGYGKTLAMLFRFAGLACDLTGTYLFWALNGAGFGFKFAGLLIKTIADMVETTAYRKHIANMKGKNVRPRGWLTAGEGVAVRLLAYAPYGIGEILDFIRGARKYRQSLNRMAARQAEKAFVISRQGRDKAKRPVSTATQKTQI